ncbi:hypothetical protein BJX96DRAFT_161263 [Aspergillus floccosus]
MMGGCCINIPTFLHQRRSCTSNHPPSRENKDHCHTLFTLPNTQSLGNFWYCTGLFGSLNLSRQLFNMSGRSRKRQKEAPCFKKTVYEVEAEVKRKMIEQCKLDACLDAFLVDFYKLFKNPGWFFPDLASVPVENSTRMKDLTSELEGNINRLLPGYLDGSTELLINEGLIEVLKTRWQTLYKKGVFDQGRSFYQIHGGGQSDSEQEETDDQSEDSFLQRMKQMAIKLQSLRLSKPIEAAPTGSTPSLKETARKEFYRQFREAIKDHESSSSFVCGGSIPMEKIALSNVRIRWSTSHDSMDRKLVLPLSENTADSSGETLEQLVKDCTPASFGKGQEDIVDPEYRKAGKLDPSQFDTSFHPADYRIIRNIERILLPSIKSQKKSTLDFREIRAELYKLNIYSGPSGLFRKHVDTPRARDQIGSLVVCLPSAFQGGDLVVRHGGKQVNFEWSDRNASAIQWAAFYSDCEHEIKTVTEGERITLTYNLYVTENGGAEDVSTPHSNVLDPQKFSLYTFLAGSFRQPDFMTPGGILGIYCSHAYPHTSPVAQELLPSILKGSDLMVYSIFQSFGIEIVILPILKDQDYNWYENSAFYRQKEYLHKGGDLEIYYDEVAGTAHEDLKKVDDRWKTLLLSRRPRGLAKTRDYATENGLEVPRDDIASEIIGESLHKYKTTDIGQDEDMNEIIDDTWPSVRIPGITWINEPAHDEMAFSYIAYGNEASIETMYSYAAILAIVPPFDERGRVMNS